MGHTLRISDGNFLVCDMVGNCSGGKGVEAGQRVHVVADVASVEQQLAVGVGGGCGFGGNFTVSERKRGGGGGV